MDNNKRSETDELQLPSPELLKKYDEISKGLSKDLINFVLKEQEHRHKLQNKYLFQFRLGQFFGIIFSLYSVYKIFELIKVGKSADAYILICIFIVLVIFALFQARSDSINLHTQKKNLIFSKKNKNNNFVKKPFFKKNVKE